SDPVVTQRVELIQALLTHQQATSEALDGRRALVEEAASAANEHLQRYQNSVHLLESHVAGALRVNQNTLQQFVDSLRSSASARWTGVGQLPDRWVELRLSLQEPRRRDRAVQIGLILVGAVLVLFVIDRILTRSILRQASPRRPALAFTLKRVFRPLELI